MASLEDVARRAGVSPITVSRVVRNHPNVSAATRDRVQRAVADLGYVPNAVARSLKQARSGLVALLVTNLISPFFAAVARGAEDAARAGGLTLVLGSSGDDPLIEAEYLQVMGEHRVDGIVLVPTDQAAAALARRLPKPMPLVLLDRTLPGVAADIVRCDTERGTAALCRHVIGLGRRRIAIVGGLTTSPTWHERVAGYQTALHVAGLPTPQGFVVPGNYRSDGGAAAVRQLFARLDRPDAVIAANAQVALGALDEFVARGCRVPDDVAVGAIDDPLPPSAFWPRLTVVEQPGYEMGKAAIELLLTRMRPDASEVPPRDLVFDASLRIGVSCGEGG